MPKLILYSWWRSSCSWRVRAALLLKGLEYECLAVDLDANENESPEFKKISPFGQVPALEIQDSGVRGYILQSLAIIEYLEEAFADTRRLLPDDVFARAEVRMIAECIASGIQPHQNKAGFHDESSDDHGQEMAKETIVSRFRDLELILAATAGKFSVGDEVTMADVCLVPQVYNAIRFGIDVSQFEIISRINQELLKLDAFIQSHPLKQADAPTGTSIDSRTQTD